jgi:hypothetical protein
MKSQNPLVESLLEADQALRETELDVDYLVREANEDGFDLPRDGAESLYGNLIDDASTREGEEEDEYGQPGTIEHSYSIWADTDGDWTNYGAVKNVDVGGGTASLRIGDIVLSKTAIMGDRRGTRYVVVGLGGWAGGAHVVRPNDLRSENGGFYIPPEYLVSTGEVSGPYPATRFYQGFEG